MPQGKNKRQIQIAKDADPARQCFAVFRELRPHLRSKDELVKRWQKQTMEGYEIAYVEEDSKVAAVAGYRYLNTLAWGKIMYIDDLVAAQTLHRTGLGTLLLQHLQSVAKRRGCDAVHLDTGFQRHLAHRAYLRNGFHIHCHHMAWNIGSDRCRSEFLLQNGGLRFTRGNSSRLKGLSRQQ